MYCGWCCDEEGESHGAQRLVTTLTTTHDVERVNSIEDIGSIPPSNFGRVVPVTVPNVEPSVANVTNPAGCHDMHQRRGFARIR